MRAASTYADQTRRVLSLLRAIAERDHTPASLITHLGISQPTFYRMLNEVDTFGARIEWDGKAYRVRSWGVLSRAKVLKSAT